MTSLSAPKTRLVADPSIGVADLMEPLRQLITDRDDKNVFKMVMPPAGVTGKTATPVAWLCNLASLFKAYARIAPNSIISSKRHKQAITRLEETEKINYTKKPIGDVVDILDDTLRMGLAHLRQLKQSSDCKERAFRRADQDQKRVLDEILDILNVSPEPETQQLALVAKTPTPKRDISPPPVSSGPSMSSRPTKEEAQILNYEGIFDHVLGQDRDGECVITFCKPQGAKAPKSTLSESPEATPSPKKKRLSPKGKHSAFELALNESDKKMIEEAQQTSPIVKDGKSQQQRLNQRKPSKAKGKGKGQANAKQKQLAEAGSKAKAKPKAGVLKRPSCSMFTEVDCSTFPVVMPSWEPDPNSTEDTRGKARNKYVSKAYHSTCIALKQAGATDWDKMKEAGRRAHKVAGEKFDQIWPREGIPIPQQEEKGGEEERPSKTKDKKTVTKTKKSKKKRKAKTTKQKGKKPKNTDAASQEPPLKRDDDDDDDDAECPATPWDAD